jgi:uncharacterized coiled-coil protein SlyX
MSSSDARMFEALAERVNALDVRLTNLADVVLARKAEIDRLEAKLATLSEAVLGKDVSAELYGSEPDHGADREARAALLAKRRDRAT